MRQSSLRFDQYLSVLCLVLGIGLLPVRPSLAAPSLLNTSQVVPQLPAAPIPVSQLENELASSIFTATLSAHALYVLDVPSGAVLLAKNPDTKFYPASTTKLMTALVAAETFGLDRVLTFDQQSLTEGTSIGLEVGESLTVQDLLQGLLIQSGNDAAMVLANYHPGGYFGFIEAMNAKAKELHLDQTTFTNPSGLDTFNHQSTARDLAILSLEVMKHPVLSQIVKTKTSTVMDVTLTKQHPLVNTNQLLALRPEIVGVKTGTTPLAGEVLISRSKSDANDVLVVLMGSQDRYRETERILNWVTTNYIWHTPESATLLYNK